MKVRDRHFDLAPIVGDSPDISHKFVRAYSVGGVCSIRNHAMLYRIETRRVNKLPIIEDPLSAEPGNYLKWGAIWTRLAQM